MIWVAKGPPLAPCHMQVAGLALPHADAVSGKWFRAGGLTKGKRSWLKVQTNAAAGALQWN